MQNTSKREVIKIWIIFLFSIVAMFITLYLSVTTKSERTYDCSIAEISPDYPIAVKEGCRKLRMEKIDNSSK